MDIIWVQIMIAHTGVKNRNMKKHKSKIKYSDMHLQIILYPVFVNMINQYFLTSQVQKPGNGTVNIFCFNSIKNV